MKKKVVSGVLIGIGVACALYGGYKYLLKKTSRR